MWEKSEVVQLLWAFVSHAELQTGECLKILQSDRGGKYTAGEVQQFLEEKGIQHKITTTNMPQHNGVAQCMNCMLLEQVRMMLTDADLLDSYWWDTLQYAALLHNMSPTRSLDNSTPEEA